MKDSRDGNRKKAPDGGWGWFVCLGSSLITLSLRSLDPSFGLLFHDLLEDLNIDSTGTSLIMGILDAIVNFSGLLVGPLLKIFSYRKVALFGSMLSCTGLILTSRANSMLHIICTYSIMGGLGAGLALASSFVALNTFFDKKRGQAVGFAMAGTTLAMMLVPQMIHLLLEAYGFRGTMLIIGGWALHSVVGACLLRPVPSEQEEIEERSEDDALLNGKENEVNKKVTNEVKSGVTEPLNDHSNGNSDDCSQNKDIDEIENASPKECENSWLTKFRQVFDLDLLKDSVYVNVIGGAGLYYVAESNFKLMTPFFLSDLGLTNAEVASCLSATAFTDILARLLLPTIFDRLGYRKRIVFWISSLLVGIGRSVLAERTKGNFLIAVFVVIGFLRGVTIVNMNLSISESCSLNKLPSAYGMYMVAKGVFVVTMSPVIGYTRDVTNSYRICIHVMTAMIVTTFLAWSIEFTCNEDCRLLLSLSFPVANCDAPNPVLIESLRHIESVSICTEFAAEHIRAATICVLCLSREHRVRIGPKTKVERRNGRPPTMGSN